MFNTATVNDERTRFEPPDFIIMALSQFHNSYPFVGQLVLLMGIDIITGILAAGIAKTVSSTTAYEGMVRKAIMLLLVGLGVILEPYAQEVPLGKMLALSFSVVEVLSIIENAARAGVPIPEVLRDFLIKLRSNNGTLPKNDKTTNSVINVNHADQLDVHDNQLEVTNDGKSQ